MAPPPPRRPEWGTISGRVGRHPREDSRSERSTLEERKESGRKAPAPPTPDWRTILGRVGRHPREDSWSGGSTLGEWGESGRKAPAPPTSEWGTILGDSGRHPREDSSSGGSTLEKREESGRKLSRFPEDPTGPFFPARSTRVEKIPWKEGISRSPLPIEPPQGSFLAAPSPSVVFFWKALPLRTPFPKPGCQGQIGPKGPAHFPGRPRGIS